MRLIRCLAILLCAVAVPWAAMAGEVNLAWDANNPAPEGYRLYLRTEGAAYDYSAPAWSGTETTCTIEGLTPGETYFFVVRAFNGADESGDSNEVGFLSPVYAPCVNLLNPDGSRVESIQAGSTYLIGNTGLIADVREPPEENDLPPYSINASGTIYHRQGCRWYNPDNGINDPATECPVCRSCKVCGGEY